MKPILFPILFMVFFPVSKGLAEPSKVLLSQNTAQQSPVTREYLRITPPVFTVKSTEQKETEQETKKKPVMIDKMYVADPNQKTKLPLVRQIVPAAVHRTQPVKTPPVASKPVIGEKLIFEDSIKKVVQPKLQVAEPMRVMIDLEKTRKLILGGNEKQAASYIKSVAQSTDTAEQKAFVTATYANELSKVSRIKKDDIALQTKAVELYKKSLQSLKGDIKLQTANNFGTLLLRQNDPREALKVLQTVEKDYSQQTDQVKQSTYFYNLGRAYEKSGDLTKAKATYQKAAIADPSFSPASRAVNRLLPKVKVDSKSIKETAQWLNELVDKGDLPLAQKTLLSVLSQKEIYSQQGFETVLIPLIRYFTATKVGPDRFSQEWHKKLPPRDKVHKKTASVIKEIIGAYTADYEINFQPHSGSRYLRATLTAAKDANRMGTVTDFVKMIGDEFQGMKIPEQALHRYATAWTIDTTNMEAAYAVAYTLLDRGDELAGVGRLLNDFIFQLFELKGAAYKAPVGQDWENILRFHLVLGTIYSKKGKWGNEYNPKSAIFQLKHAVKSHSLLMKQKKVKDPGPIAGVKFELGNAYEQSGNFRRAGSIYVKAAQSAINEKDTPFAREIVAKVRDNSDQYRLSNKDRKTLVQLDAKLNPPFSAPINIRFE